MPLAYVQSVETVNQSGLWNSLGIDVRLENGDHETHRPVKQSRYSWLSGGYMVIMYSSRGKIWYLNHIWPWKSMAIVPQNNRDVNQGVSHLWSKVWNLAWTSDALLWGQAQNGINYDFKSNLTLKVKLGCPPKPQRPWPRCFKTLVQILWS